MNANLSQEIVSLMSMMQTQVIRAINPANIDKVIQKIYITGNLPLDQNGTVARTGTGTSVYDQDVCNDWKRAKCKTYKEGLFICL